MADITMDVDEVLELDYLVQDRSPDQIGVTKDPNGYNLTGFETRTGVFEPNGTGIYKVDVNDQVYEIKVVNVPDSGISRWRFDQDVTDSWGENDGIRYGGSFTSNAVVGDSGYSFSDGDYIDVGVLSLSGSISLSVWIYPTQLSGPAFAISNYGGGGGSANHFLLGTGASGAANNNQPSFFIDDGSPDAGAVTAPSINTNNYYHLVGVYDDESSETRIYLDGTREGVSSWSGSTPNWLERRTQIGSPPSGSTNFVGDMDDPRVFNKALSDTEVSNLFSTGSIDG